MVRHLANPTHPSDVDAFVQLLERLPQLADAMDHQVIPLLSHLKDVVPDMNQLLDQAYQFRHMASRLPRVFPRPNHQPLDCGFAPLSQAVYPRIRRKKSPMSILEPTALLPEGPAPVRHPSLRVVPPRQGVDLAAAQRAVADLLVALGKDPNSEHLSDTPRRVAHSFAELLTPQEFDLTTFPNDEGYDELVLAKSIPVQSLCEHHLLPFHGTAHIGYLPGERILGLSKLARVVEMFSRDLQVQERLTQQIADGLQEHLAPKGVGVVIEAEHLCMSLRGVRATGSRTVTSALHGLLREDARSRQEFFALAGVTR